MGILDSGSEVVVMPKCIWKELGLPLRSDHVLWMTSVNTSVDSTIGVLENLALDFGVGDVLLQVQIMGVTVRGQNLIFSIMHWSPSSSDSPLTFTISTMFFTDVYQYTIW